MRRIRARSGSRMFTGYSLAFDGVPLHQVNHTIGAIYNDLLHDLDKVYGP